jgi:hypothetical protein
MPRKKTPHALAARVVERYFQAMMTDREFMNDGSIEANHLDAVFEEVSDLLEAEHVKQHGPIKRDDDLTRWAIGMEAGYIVGVQIGMRLAGGAR